MKVEIKETKEQLIAKRDELEKKQQEIYSEIRDIREKLQMLEMNETDNYVTNFFKDNKGSLIKFQYNDYLAIGVSGGSDVDAVDGDSFVTVKDYRIFYDDTISHNATRYISSIQYQLISGLTVITEDQYNEIIDSNIESLRIKK